MNYVSSSLLPSAEQHVYKYFSSVLLGFWLFKLMQKSKMFLIQWKQKT